MFEHRDEEFVTIYEQDYEELVKDRKLLNALRAAGVDNWQGFDVAIEAMEKEDT